jgi:hypothetical protein
MAITNRITGNEFWSHHFRVLFYFHFKVTNFYCVGPLVIAIVGQRHRAGSSCTIAVYRTEALSEKW